MKILPLIGALTLSATPVQAFETYDEYVAACIASKENTKLCDSSGEFCSALSVTTTLCKSEERGFLSAEEVAIYWEKVGLDAQPDNFFKEGLELSLNFIQPVQLNLYLEEA